MSSIASICNFLEKNIVLTLEDSQTIQTILPTLLPHEQKQLNDCLQTRDIDTINECVI